MATAEQQLSEIEGVLAAWREREIADVRFELPDMHGTSRSKIVPIDHAARYARDGLNMYGGTVVLDTRSDVVPGTLYNEEVAYADQRLFPDPATARVVPWLPATGRLICESAWNDGRPLEAAPRRVFGRVLERCHQLGYEPLIGIEAEFHLLDPETLEPLFGGSHIFNTVRNTWTPVIGRMIEEMRAFGIDIITANCEYAGAQWEINYAPGRGLEGPDLAYGFKNGIKEIAHREGLLATFMSKPFADSAGSGAHTHVGLLGREDEENAMADPGDEYGLSAVGRSFVAGMLRHSAAIHALLSPTVNCFKRRRTHTFSPTNVSWGSEDRTALVRVTGTAASRHVENRAPSGMANPYLACAAVLGAGLLGIEDELELEPPARGPAEEDPTKAPLPSSVGEALGLLEADERIIDLLGGELVSAYATMRRHELGRFDDYVTDWERSEYLELF